MPPDSTPTILETPERPWRLACSRTVDGVRTFLHEFHATRPEALVALELYALTGEWDAIVLTPFPLTRQPAPDVAARTILAVGGRLRRPAPEE